APAGRDARAVPGGPEADAQWWRADGGGPRPARQRVRPGAETQLPAAAPEPEQSELRRVRLAGREARGGTDQDRAHRPGLHRGDERTDRARHGAGAAERLAGAGAAAVQAAVDRKSTRLNSSHV